MQLKFTYQLKVIDIYQKFQKKLNFEQNIQRIKFYLIQKKIVKNVFENVIFAIKLLIKKSKSIFYNFLCCLLSKIYDA